MATTEVDTNNILTVKRRSVQAKAVQFTGKNGAEVVAFVNAELIADRSSVHVRNGGSYVTISDPGAGGRARKGDWVVFDVDDRFRVFTPELFSKLFLIKS